MTLRGPKSRLEDTGPSAWAGLSVVFNPAVCLSYLTTLTFA